MFLYDCKSTFLSNIFYNFVFAKFLKMRTDIFSSVRLLIVPRGIEIIQGNVGYREGDAFNRTKRY